MPDDEELNNLPPTTVLWMAAMVAKDEDERFDRDLSFVEYLATFINPEAVKSVRDKRAAPEFGVEEDNFLDILSKISGRDAPVLKKDK